ncbi:hypothetical protein [Christensenella tenuis]|uniref:DUF4430 domain-containing protein n=1 Tax=Christensenella tenuis TaxID=2763033 RepID=A0ABR7EED8_9FIRM|nr:hypothetical protein [Christensenella tenuis]MBC5648135.1 hypothetical protein [Christensenella tenuis]
MKKSVWSVLSRIIAVALGICLFAGCLFTVQAQNTIAPENPITEKKETQSIPLTSASAIQIDEDLLDLDSDVTEAESQETNEEEFSAETISDSLNSGAIAGENTESGNGGGAAGTGSTPGSESFTLPSNVNYFFVDIVDLQQPYYPSDPRCYYRITHIYPELEVENIVILDNGQPVSHYGGNADEGWLNLVSGENWLTVQVTYRLPNGETKTFERATNPAMVLLQDPLDITFEDNLKAEYDNPAISFYVNPSPAEANVQVYANGSLVPLGEDGQYHATLNQGENKITYRAKAAGWNDTEISQTVIYRKTAIRVYSPELEEMRYETGYTHYEDTITFSTRVENIETGEPVSGVKMDIYLQGTLVKSLSGGDHDNITLNLPIAAMNGITIVARGANSENNETQSAEVSYIVNKRPGGPTPDEVLAGTKPNANLPAVSTTHDPTLDFRVSPTTIDTTGDSYAISTHKVKVYHTSTVTSRTYVLMREDIMGLYCYTVNLDEGYNLVELVLVTDELYEITYRYEVYYIPQPSTGEPIGSIYVSVDASVIGLSGIAAGYVDIYEGDSLGTAVRRLLEQHGYQVSMKGESNYAMYIEAIIKKGMLSGWSQDMIGTSERQMIEQAIQEDPNFWTGNYDYNSLGEFDFTTGSGWMFTLNGTPISGLSNEFPKDGDTCKMMFSLMRGSDIGL